MHVIVELDGEKLAESMTEPCLTCSDVDVGGKAMTLMLPLLAELPAREVAEPPAPAAVEPAEPAEHPRTGQIRLISGGVLLGAGLVGVGVGASLIAADERVVSDPEALELDVVKYREVGIATLVIGGATAVTGSVLLGLALRERSRLAVAPVVGPRVVGLSLGGRF